MAGGGGRMGAQAKGRGLTANGPIYKEGPEGTLADTQLGPPSTCLGTRSNSASLQ